MSAKNMEAALAITSNLPFTKEDINKLANAILGIAKDGEPGHLASTADKSTRTSFESARGPATQTVLTHIPKSIAIREYLFVLRPIFK